MTTLDPDVATRVARAEFVKRALIVLTTILVMGVLVTTLLILARISERASDNAAILESSETTLDLIRDCTSPGGKCFRRGREQTAGAVADINLISIYASACADQLGRQTVLEVQRCVIARLADDGPTP